MKRITLCTLALLSGFAQAEWPYPSALISPSSSSATAAKPARATLLLVKLNPYATAADMDSLQPLLHSHAAQIVGGKPSMGLIQIRTSAPQALQDALSKHPAVQSAPSNINLTLSAVDNAEFAPNGAWWFDAIRAEQAWSVTRGSPAVKIAVVDSGMSSTQQSVDSNRISFVDKDGAAMPIDDTPTVDHGTAIMVFAAGYNDDPATHNDPSTGNNVRGVDHQASALSVDVFDGGLSVAGLLDGIETAATMGSHLISISISESGAGCADDACKYNKMRVFREAFDPAVITARDNGALILLTSTNVGLKNDDVLFNSGSFDTVDAERRWGTNVLTVGASTNSSTTQFTLSDRSDSSTGQVVDLLAPGSAQCPVQGGNPDLSCNYSGTSFSTPVVAGIGGLVASADSTFRPAEWRRVIMDSAANIIVSANEPKLHADAANAAASAELLASSSYDGQAPIVFNASGQTATVTITTAVPAAGLFAGDIMFLQDVSQSQHDDIDALQATFSSLITDLESRGINFNYGVSGFSDFPSAPYGDPNDVAFKLLSGITNDIPHVQAKVNTLDTPLLSGGDARESQYEGIRQLLTGTGLDQNTDGDYNDAGDIKPAAIGWRTTAKKIIVLSTDAPFHNNAPEAGYPGAPKATALNLINTHNATVIGLDSHNTKGDLAELTSASGGQYFRVTATPNEIGDAIEAAITQMQSSVDVTTETISGDQFVTSIAPTAHTGLAPGAAVSFTVQITNPYPNLNSTAPNQQHELVIWVRGNGAVFHRVYVPIQITP